MKIITTRHIRQRCPVCEGRKTVPGGFYSGLPVTGPEPCQQCFATGMVGATEVVEAVDDWYDNVGKLGSSARWP